ncbi:response regulator [Paenibacillus puerhi]|uniref:response regulator n=1 Tax=Paenibacillus puerhi TaxID=2692622 RepID=UPI00135A4FE7|nr:response regulator [Paenibacillus puerhi]
MFKVLLVDDEVFVRKGLQHLIDWEALGYTVVDEAENGEEALSIIESTNPDLVVTDIRMPVLDGLDLIRSVKDKQVHDPTFIIISGYHDFKYAQQALRYGVHDYILKPIDEMELQTTLCQLKDGLGKKKLARLNKEKHVSGSILGTLLQTPLTEEDVHQLAASLNLTASAPLTYIIVEVHAGQAIAELGNAEARISEALTAAGLPEGSVPVYEQRPGVYGILLNNGWAAAAEGRSQDDLRQLHDKLEKALGGPVTLFAGKSVDRIRDVRESYATANEAMRHKYAEFGEVVVDYEQVRDKALHMLDMDSDLYRRLMDQLEENDAEAFAQTIDDVFQQFSHRRFAPNAVSNAISRCIIGALHVIREMEGKDGDLDTLSDMLEWQQRSLSATQLKALFVRFMTETAAYMERLRKEQTKGGIEKIKKYIETHYTENMSLKSIAAKFYMNPVYLGQLFRKTYHVYFNDFLLNLRIQEAKRLLRQTDLRMYEVAGKVGFQNADYFVTQFEKLEKLTPTEYRNKLLGKK